MKTFGLFMIIFLVVEISYSIILTTEHFTVGDNFIIGMLASWILYNLLKEELNDK